MSLKGNSYIEPLIELHQLIAKGDGESEAADNIREALSDLWLQVSEVDRQRLDGLSADLYALADKEMYDEESEYSRLPIIDLRKLCITLFNSDPIKFLEVLRTRDDIYPKYLKSYIRGRIWERLGYGHVAYLFFSFASELSKNENYEYLALNALKESPQREKCLNVALEIGARILQGERKPKVAYVVCSIINDLSQSCGKDHSLSFQKMLSDILNASIPQLAGIAANKADKTVLIGSYLLLGNALARLGHTKKALISYKRAVDSRTDDCTAWTALGLHRFKYGIGDAYNVLKKAIELGEKLVWPFLILAFLELQHVHNKI